MKLNYYFGIQPKTSLVVGWVGLSRFGNRRAIRAEVRRYMVIPGQATGYMMGMRKIKELRAKAETELAENFDIRDFHDAILGGGSLPLHILESEVDRWIEQVRAGV